MFIFACCRLTLPPSTTSGMEKGSFLSATWSHRGSAPLQVRYHSPQTSRTNDVTSRQGKPEKTITNLRLFDVDFPSTISDVAWFPSSE